MVNNDAPLPIWTTERHYYLQLGLEAWEDTLPPTTPLSSWSLEHFKGSWAGWDSVHTRHQWVYKGCTSKIWSLSFPPIIATGRVWVFAVLFKSGQASWSAGTANSVLQAEYAVRKENKEIWVMLSTEIWHTLSDPSHGKGKGWEALQDWPMGVFQSLLGLVRGKALLQHLLSQHVNDAEVLITIQVLSEATQNK